MTAQTTEAIRPDADRRIPPSTVPTPDWDIADIMPADEAAQQDEEAGYGYGV